MHSYSPEDLMPTKPSQRPQSLSSSLCWSLAATGVAALTYAVVALQWFHEAPVDYALAMKSPVSDLEHDSSGRSSYDPVRLETAY